MPSSKWLIFLPVALFALFAPQPAQASQSGLLVRGYSITEIPPLKSDTAYEMCGTSIEPFINATWDYEQNLFGDCGWDLFMLHYTGYLQIPEHQTIEFWIASDDGGTIKIGTEEFGVWQDQGCSATETGLMDIAAGTHAIDAWMYENGGGTCFMFAWNIDGAGWEIVQPEFFTSEPLPTPSTTTTEPSTTTTEMPPSTTTTSSSTTLPPTTTSAPSTTLPQSTTSSTQMVTTTTVLQTTSTVTIPQTMPSVEPTVEETTTTTAYEPLFEEPVTTDNVAETVPDAEVTLGTVVPVLDVLPQEEPQTTVIDEPQVDDSAVTVEGGTLVSVEQFAAIVEQLDNASEEEVVAIVEELLKADLSNEQVAELVTDVHVLTSITGEQAAQVFAQIEETQLSEAMAEVIAATLNSPDVPEEVKEAFEEQIDIFGNDGFSEYVPIGSNVSVAVRRTIIVGTTILVAMPSPAVRRTR
jgi:hypothetical protein